MRSVNHPIRYGPTKPPIVPIELMNARPPAAAMPVRKRGGIVQKMPARSVDPVSATVRPHTDTQKFARKRSRRGSPRPRRRHASARLTTLLPRRSTCAGPQNHADGRHDVAAAGHEPDLDIRELPVLENLRQEDADAVGADQKSELHARPG